MLETAKLSAAEVDARQMRRTIRRYCGRRAASAFAFNDAARVMRLLMGRILPPEYCEATRGSPRSLEIQVRAGKT
jgi:hypothetical protein